MFRFERLGLTSQIRRAAVSVSSNIAGGSGRSSNNDFSRFIEIAYGSVIEIVSQLQIANALQFITEDDVTALFSQAEEIAKMQNGLKRSLASRD